MARHDGPVSERSAGLRLVFEENFDAAELDRAVWLPAVDWTTSNADFLVDGKLVRSCPRPPAYPMQFMLAVFDFPEKSDGTDEEAVPAFIVDWVWEFQR